jgi:hypothetical protein
MASEYKPNLGVIEITAATTLDDDAYAGRTVNLNSTTGRIVTLPSATGSGATYTIFVGATVSSGSHVIRVAAGTNVMQGVLGIATDAAGVTCPTAADSDTITMNGSTTGGLRGSVVELQDIASGIWAVRGSLVSTGAEATPFSAAVS